MKRKVFLNIVLIAVSFVALIGFGCDSSTTPAAGGCDTGGTTSNNGICSEKVSVANTQEAVLYYPCNISGPTGATTMSSGWTATLHDITFLTDEVVKNGFVVLGMTPTNELGMVTQWRQGHKSCIQKLIDLNNNHSVLRGKIDTSKLQTCGHSKGGGGSLWASSELGGTVRSAIGMAPYQGTEFALTELRTMKAATFVQAAGVSDTLATPTMTKGEYDALPNGISKCYKRHGNWGHMEWANSYVTYHSQITKEVVGWMKYYLNNDSSGASAIETRDSGVNVYEWIK